MTSLPSAPTDPVVGGAVATGTFGIPVSQWVNFLRSPPAFTIRQHTTATSVPNNAWTTLPMDDEVVDTVNGHSLVTNTSRYTAVYPGAYRFYGKLVIASNATNFRAVAITLNGAVPNDSSLFAIIANTLGQTYVSIEVTYQLVVGDYVQLQAFQNSGGALNTILDGTVMSGQWVST